VAITGRQADHGDVPDRRSGGGGAGPEPAADDVSPGELFEGGTGPSWWSARWATLTQGGRRLVAGLALLVLLGGGAVLVRTWAAERELRQAVELTATVGVWSSSTNRPGGEVGYFLRVGNVGPLPLSVTSVAAAGAGVQVRMRDDGARQVAPGREIEIPLSVRVTCVRGATARPAMDAEIAVRRDDGGATSRRVDLQPAEPVLDAAATLCEVRPDLRDHELSGPVLRPPGDG
jgi:hypothetical protein